MRSFINSELNRCEAKSRLNCQEMTSWKSYRPDNDPSKNVEPPTFLVETSKGPEVIDSSGATEASGPFRLVNEQNPVEENVPSTERDFVEERVTGPPSKVIRTSKGPLVCLGSLDVNAEMIELEESDPKAFVLVVIIFSFLLTPRGDYSERESTPLLGPIASSSHHSPSRQRHEQASTPDASSRLPKNIVAQQAYYITVIF
ncbi:hypothetical protein Nepgr_027692 [Nepenthes gracilis]|uniref:Uncharacterized protein n=1 Tax=Nepenthes gracilis TaxID=150966 RepID=A0AAD3TBE0_NEPGR|nr:hypothetical protein Nepgr_027692 [Nepenthes gracilis]